MFYIVAQIYSNYKIINIAILPQLQHCPGEQKNFQKCIFLSLLSIQTNWHFQLYQWWLEGTVVILSRGRRQLDSVSYRV